MYWIDESEFCLYRLWTSIILGWALLYPLPSGRFPFLERLHRDNFLWWSCVCIFKKKIVFVSLKKTLQRVRVFFDASWFLALSCTLPARQRMGILMGVSRLSLLTSSFTWMFVASSWIIVKHSLLAYSLFFFFSSNFTLRLLIFRRFSYPLTRQSKKCLSQPIDSTSLYLNSRMNAASFNCSN